MTERSQQKTGYILVFTAGCLWGTIGFFVTLLGDIGVDSYMAAFLRMLFASLVFVPIVRCLYGREGMKLSGTGMALAFAMGIFSQGLFNISYVQSIRSIGVATASVLLYTAPVFVCIMARIVFKDRITIPKLIALAVNILGCFLTVTNGNFSSIQFSVFGAVMGVCAGFLYALTTILGKIAALKGCNTITVTMYSFIIGAVFLAVIAKPWLITGEMFSWKFILLAIGFGLIPTVGSYFTYMKGLSKPVQASKVPVIASVETVVAAGIGIGVFSESCGILKIAGIICVLISILIMSNVRQ